ncbi:hypothetical protein ACIRRH_33860 [Kitasatospora sp. NPDC101235]|uniref:hypothetical protein n=1 Tax=Kitasatospora sp. NPDC101235 TaxID=3364101 RepID=UPI0037F6DD72
MGQFITDIDVLVPYEKPSDRTPIRTPTGWELIPFDLNSGAGGAYLYLVYEKHLQDRPITGLRILKNDERPPTGYQTLPVDLNKGVKNESTSLFLAVTREAGAAITDLAVTHWTDPAQHIPPKQGYLRVQYAGTDIDLNLGAGGDFIFLDYRPAMNSQENA